MASRALCLLVSRAPPQTIMRLVRRQSYNLHLVGPPPQQKCACCIWVLRNYFASIVLFIMVIHSCSRQLAGRSMMFRVRGSKAHQLFRSKSSLPHAHLRDTLRCSNILNAILNTSLDNVYIRTLSVASIHLYMRGSLRNRRQ